MLTRKSFIQKTAIATGIATVGSFPFESLATNTVNDVSLTILHTNDVHSRLDPFPMDGSKYEGMGGVVNREKLIRSIREKSKHVLLLDCGDMFQGTPYFNLYKGEPEMKIMSMLKYDAGTLGNHDFDNGIEGLNDQLPHADFPIVNCNYDFSNTILAEKIVPYTIIRKGKLKIGILGVGIELKGLVPDALCKDIVYHNPVPIANEIAYMLKYKKRCDYVICLSHLGFEYKENKLSDKTFAPQTEHIDMILGGHTHTFLDEPVTVNNRINKPVIINQVGWAGIVLGKIDIYFNHKQAIKHVENSTGIFIKQTSV
jgi:5'-nucleotidase